MKRSLVCTFLILLAALAVGSTPAEEQAEAVNPVVVMKTNMGEVRIELFEDKAPITVENFLSYTDAGQYDGTIFHRVMAGFMIQGGGFDENLAKKETRAPIKNEANNGLKNKDGTIAMARTPDPHSATAQFFINTSNNVALNHVTPNQRGWGYAVFGKVISGMEVVRKIEASSTAARGVHRNLPVKAVVIESVRRQE